MENSKLFMLLLGCKPKGRNTEQHDTLFAIGNCVKDLIPQILDFWPDAGTIHLDAWREINMVDGYSVKIIPAEEQDKPTPNKLFFLNLGGYKKSEFEEFHYKMITVAPDKATAVNLSKKTAFFKHTGFKGAESHIDEKYGVDVDDMYEIKDILKEPKGKFSIHVSGTKSDNTVEDKIHLGYFKLNSL